MGPKRTIEGSDIKEPAWATVTKEQSKKIMCDMISRKVGDYPIIKFFNPDYPELDNLIDKASKRTLVYEDFDDEFPLYHTLSPAKADGLYAQYKGKEYSGSIYCHVVSALFREFHIHPEFKTGLDVWNKFEDIEKRSIIEVNSLSLIALIAFVYCFLFLLWIIHGASII